MSLVEFTQNWDHEADVIIVGGGTAGLPAAVLVAEAGLKATVLESRQACGGSFAMVMGCMAFAGTDEEKIAGIDDSPEVFYENLVNVCGSDPEIASAYANNQLDAYKMLKDQGIKLPGLVPHPDHNRNRCLGWVSGMGPKLVKAVEDRARDRGVEILLRYRATRLITDRQTGRVIGLKVDVNGEIKNFKAKRAVILATGGFGRNRDMIAEYAPEFVNAVPMMPVSHLGDGLKMGMAIGAATKDIGIAVNPSFPACIETHSNALWALWQGAIVVNVYGKRFHDESCSGAFYGFYGSIGGAGMRQPGGVYWVVFSNKMKADVGKVKGVKEINQQHVRSIERCKQYKAYTIEELAESAGIDAKGLKETIDKYNSDIDSVGYDTVLGRKCQWGSTGTLVKIDKTSFYAIKCVTSITSMKGGLKINGRSQVINQYGEVIPGLYAAGEVTGGLHTGLNTRSHLLGMMSSSAMTFGIIAGRNAVEEPAWS